MSDLQFVAFSDDGKAVILQNDAGEWIEVPITEQRPTSVSPIRPVVESSEQLTPREIQSRIRAGASPEEVSAESGVPLERVMTFAPPIIMERRHVASKAMKTIVRRANGSGALGEVVNSRLEPLGVDPLTLDWDSYRREDGRWNVTLNYPTSEGQRYASWLYDVRNSALVPADDEARWLIGEPLPKGSQSHPEHPTLVVPHLSVVKASAVETRVEIEQEEPPAEVAPVRPLREAEPEAPEASDGLFAFEVEEQVDVLQLDPTDTEHSIDVNQDVVAESEGEVEGEFERLTRPEPQEKRRSRLPSWDEILFGKSDD